MTGDGGGAGAVAEAEWAGGLRVGFRPCSYDPEVFSPRVRAHLPCRHLSTAGVAAEIVPPDGAGAYDVVVFQKAYAKADLALAAALAARGAKVVFDLCDNHFYAPEDRPGQAAQVERLRDMIARADVVSVSTPEIGKLVEDKPTFVVDDALELAHRSRPGRRRGSDSGGPRTPVRIVWQGQRGTKVPRSGLFSLTKLVPDLEALHPELPLRLTVIGNSKEAFRAVLGEARFPVRYVPWRPRTFARRFVDHDVCVIPVDLNPFTVCKSNNRPVLALLLGLPVVADAVPSYRELDGFVTFPGDEPGSWAEAIRRYATDPALAARHVDEGRRHVEETYTPARVVAQWSHVLRAALRSGASA